MIMLVNAVLNFISVMDIPYKDQEKETKQMF